MAIVYDGPSNTITVTGYTEDVPCTMHDVWLADQAGGWGVISEYIQDRMYQCAAILEIGDGGTETWFQSMEEAVHFPTGCYPNVKDHATLTLGDKATDAWRGSFWQSEDPTASPTWYGDFRAYASIFQMVAPAGWRQYGFRGTNTIEHSSLQGPSDMLHQFTWRGVDSVFTDVYFCGGYSMFTIEVQVVAQPADIVVGESNVGIQVDADGVSLLAPTVLEGVAAPRWIRLYDGATTIVNPGFEPTQANIEIKQDSASLYWDVLTDIHVVDKDGADLAGVGVECKDKDDNVVFDVNTAASGSIAQQQVHRKLWEAIAETETDYSPHKFTFTFPSGSVLIFEGITLSDPIDWHVEEPDWPGITVVKAGESYAGGGLVGTYVGEQVQIAVEVELPDATVEIE